MGRAPTPGAPRKRLRSIELYVVLGVGTLTNFFRYERNKNNREEHFIPGATK
jgi:hypothetical protein